MIEFVGFKVAGGSAFVEKSTFKQQQIETDENVVIVFECVAATWEEANQKWNDFNGWGKYEPMVEE